MAEGSTCFKDWLYADLNSLGLDEEIYGDYIIGSLDVLKENSIEEKVDAVMELLSEVLTDDCRAVCQRIVEQWTKENPPVKKKKSAPSKSLTMQDHVDKFLKQTTPLAPPTIDESSSHQPQMSATEKKQLLIQYGCASDDEDEHETNIETSNKGDIFLNTNKSVVSMVLKQQREEQKIAHENKLEQDKKSREMQRQRQQERKEKEKKRTQKQERKR